MNYTPQNWIISSFSALYSISVLLGTLLSSALKMKKFSRLEVSESEDKNFVSGKARRNGMYLAYMEPKRRSRTHILGLLSVLIAN